MPASSASGQLSLPLAPPDPPAARALPDRRRLPIAARGGQPFDDPAFFFEPWWPGAYAAVRRLDDALEMRTEHLTDPLAVFPELHAIAGALSNDAAVVEGTLLALDDEGRPDARLLRDCLSGAHDEGAPAEAAFVAADLPYSDGRSLVDLPYSERRARLAAALRDGPHWVVGRGLVGEGTTMGHAVASMGLEAISARRLDARWRPGRATDAWLRLPVVEPPAGHTRPFLVLLETLPLQD